MRPDGNNLNLVFFGASEGAEWEIFDSVLKSTTSESYTFFHTDAECAETY
jgi:hypothetical protein